MVVSLNLLGLTLYFLINLPSRVIELPLWQETIQFEVSGQFGLAILLSALTLAGAGAVIRRHPDQKIPYTVPFWVNPTGLIFLAALTLNSLGTVPNWILGLSGTGILLWITILAEYHALRQTRDHRQQWGRQWSQTMSYALLGAFALLIARSSLHPALGIGGLGITSWLLAQSILKFESGPDRPSLHFGLIIGLGLAQTSWLLQFLPLNSLGQALLSLWVFYLLCTSILTYFRQTLSRRLFVEYGGLSLLVLGIILWLL